MGARREDEARGDARMRGARRGGEARRRGAKTRREGDRAKTMAMRASGARISGRPRPGSRPASGAAGRRALGALRRKEIGEPPASASGPPWSDLPAGEAARRCGPPGRAFEQVEQTPRGPLYGRSAPVLEHGFKLSLQRGNAMLAKVCRRGIFSTHFLAWPSGPGALEARCGLSRVPWRRSAGLNSVSGPNWGRVLGLACAPRASARVALRAA